MIEALAEIDRKLFGIFAERKSADREIDEKKQELLALREKGLQLETLLDQKRKTARKEEHALRDEEVKIQKRREEASNFSNHKVQQTVERELSHSEDQLRKREETVLALLDEVDQLAVRVAAQADQKEKLQAFAERLSIGMFEAYEAFDEREVRLKKERASLFEGFEGDAIWKDAVTLYDRAREKYPNGPLARLVNDSCAACYEKLRPQLALEVRFKGKVVRCSGCGKLVIPEATSGVEKSE